MGASRTQRAWEGEKRKGTLWKLLWASNYENRAVILLAKIIFTDNKAERGCIVLASFSGSEPQIVKNKIESFGFEWIWKTSPQDESKE